MGAILGAGIQHNTAPAGQGGLFGSSDLEGQSPEQNQQGTNWCQSGHQAWLCWQQTMSCRQEKSQNLASSAQCHCSTQPRSSSQEKSQNPGRSAVNFGKQEVGAASPPRGAVPGWFWGGSPCWGGKTREDFVYLVSPGCHQPLALLVTGRVGQGTRGWGWEWWDQHPRIIPVSSQCHPSIIPAPFQNNSSIIPESFQYTPSIIPAPSQYHLRIIPVPSQNNSSIIPVSTQYHPRIIPAPSQNHSSIIPESV